MIATKFNRPSKKLWRSLIRIERHNPHWIVIIIPARSLEEFAIKTTDVPLVILNQIDTGQKYFYVEVNIGAEKQEDLFFQNWEFFWVGN